MVQERPAVSQGRQEGRRQFVRYAFFKIDQNWRRLPPPERERGKDGVRRVVESFGNRLVVRSYSLVGMRGDVDLLLWQIGDRLEDIQALAIELFSTEMGPYLSVPYSYLAMTRRSQYVSPEEAEDRLIIEPDKAKYLFVYPFVKTRSWYALSKEERQRLMNQHISVGRKYPSIKLNTTYSFGLDDQEFVVAFEGDDPGDFLDLVMELRESETSLYTLRDTPIFTCVAMGLAEALDTLGASGAAVLHRESAVASPSHSWVRVAELKDLPDGETLVTYLHGEQVALFNDRGEIFALANRCPHANGPLADGQINGGTISCPWHGSRFDLRGGELRQGPSRRAAAAYHVKVEDGHIFISGNGGEVSAVPR